MLAVEDWLFALDWAERVGGLEALIARADANAAALDQLGAERAWIEHLAADPAIRSNTRRAAVRRPVRASADEALIKKAMARLLEAEGRRLRHRRLSRRAAGPSHLVRRDRRDRRYRGARPVARLGLGADRDPDSSSSAKAGTQH